MPRYLMVVEKVDDSYSAYLPDVPGCIATGETHEEALENLKSALRFHLEGLREDGGSLPEPRTSGDFVIVDEENPV